MSQNGVVVGVVVNTNDPMGQRRVQVRLPASAEGAEEWARVATAPDGPRSERVRFDLEDEVLVAFEHGAVRQPFVLGVLWKGGEPPPDASGIRTVHLPIGSSLHAIPENSDASLDYAATASLLQQTAPWLASMECLLRILALLKPLIDVIENLSAPPRTAFQEFAKAAADLRPCLLASTSAATLPFVRDLLCLSLQSLRCLLRQTTTQPVPGSAIAAIQGVLDLAGPFFKAAGVHPIQLSTLTDPRALQGDIDALQGAVDSLGGCG